MPGVTPQRFTADALTETDTFMLAFIRETSLSKPNQLRQVGMAVTAPHPARDEGSVDLIQSPGKPGGQMRIELQGSNNFWLPFRPDLRRAQMATQKNDQGRSLTCVHHEDA